MNDIDWSHPYPSQRMAVMGRNVVATSQPLAAQAGLRMLLAGGNAADAAVATAIALAVTEPCSNALGSDAFAMVWAPDGRAGGGAAPGGSEKPGPTAAPAGTGPLHGLNSSGRSPKGWTPDRYAGRRAMPTLGWDSVTVPGAVDAWAKLSARFGKLPFENHALLCLNCKFSRVAQSTDLCLQGEQIQRKARYQRRSKKQNTERDRRMSSQERRHG